MRSTTLERANTHRTALRAAGLRPVQIWVPDMRRAGFADECRRQSLVLIGDAHEDETLDWLAIAADTTGWDSPTEGHK
jgi:Antitoxin MazE-like